MRNKILVETRLPDVVDADAAVQFPTIYATAYAALKWWADLQPGETLLVHGAAYGINYKQTGFRDAVLATLVRGDVHV